MKLVQVEYFRPNGNFHSVIIKESQLEAIKLNSNIRVESIVPAPPFAERDYILR